jgi:FkbM family methyltransferase
MNELRELLRKKTNYVSKIFFKKFPNPSLIKNKLPVIVFGVGIVGKYVSKNVENNNQKIICYCDNNQKLWNTTFNNRKITSPSTLKKEYLNTPIIVASIIYEKEIYQQLVKMGFTKIYPLSYLNYLNPKIFDLRDYNDRYEAVIKIRNIRRISQLEKILEDSKSKKIFYKHILFRLNHFFNINYNEIYDKNNQYFDNAIVKLTKKEVFVDGGGFDGDTIKPFCKFVNNNFKNIYSFEPDKNNYKKLVQTAKNIDMSRIITVDKGLFHSKGWVNFYQLGTSTSGIGSENYFTSFSGKIVDRKNQVSIPVTSLDEYFFNKKEKPTFIKLDIEGTEKEALLGAKKIIKSFKPKLAICIYHKPSDLWEIPLLIKKLNNSYKLYIRHYSREVPETICYAV